MANDTQKLQALIDGPDSVIDLLGNTYFVDSINISAKHNNKLIKNGRVITLPDKLFRRYGVFEVIKNRLWGGVQYTDDPINITFEDLEIEGGVTNWCDDWLLMIDRANQQGYRCSGININTGLSNGKDTRVDSVIVNRCSFKNLGASGINFGKTINARATYNNFYHIAQHAIGQILDGDSSQTIKSLNSRSKVFECGTAFDYAQLVGVNDVTSQANIRIEYLKAENILGRTKIHGNWDVSLYNGNFIQSRKIPNAYCALSFIMGRTITVNKIKCENYLVGGISTLNIPERIIQPIISVKNATFNNCFTGHIIQIPTYSVSESCYNNCWQLYRSGNPSFDGPKVITLSNDNYWLNEYRAAEATIDIWNLNHGTNYVPSQRWWLPESLRTILNTMT